VAIDVKNVQDSGLLGFPLLWLLAAKSRGLWLRGDWWTISELFITEYTGHSSKIGQVLFFLPSAILLTANVLIQKRPDLTSLIVVWAVSCTAFNGQIWVTHWVCERNPSAYIETATVMNGCLKYFIAFTACSVFMHVIPAFAWVAIKSGSAQNQAAESRTDTQDRQIRNQSEEAQREEAQPFGTLDMV